MTARDKLLIWLARQVVRLLVREGCGTEAGEALIRAVEAEANEPARG